MTGIWMCVYCVSDGHDVVRKGWSSRGRIELHHKLAAVSNYIWHYRNRKELPFHLKHAVLFLLLFGKQCDNSVLYKTARVSYRTSVFKFDSCSKIRLSIARCHGSDRPLTPYNTNKLQIVLCILLSNMQWWICFQFIALCSIYRSLK